MVRALEGSGMCCDEEIRQEEAEIGLEEEEKWGALGPKLLTCYVATVFLPQQEGQAEGGVTTLDHDLNIKSQSRPKACKSGLVGFTTRSRGRFRT